MTDLTRFESIAFASAFSASDAGCDVEIELLDHVGERRLVVRADVGHIGYDVDGRVRGYHAPHCGKRAPEARWAARDWISAEAYRDFRTSLTPMERVTLGGIGGL